MKKIFFITALTLLVGAGCSPVVVEQVVSKKELTVGGVATFQIPTHCNASGGAGSTYIVCPTPDNDTPTPEMVISSDGIQVNIKRWENLSSPYWNDIIKSMRITAPLDRAVEIHIAK
jgi:hypothetical protein